MNLVFIYGPPASGKLTVAKELAKITGYKIFHNHSTIDLVSSVMEFGTDDFWKTNHRIRLQVFEASAKTKINGLIFTFCYAYPKDNKFIRDAIKTVRKNGGNALFVHLYCDKQELMKRAKETSRKKFKKIKTRKGIRDITKDHDFYTPIPFAKSLRIDNTGISAMKAARIIADYYKLTRES